MRFANDKLLNESNVALSQNSDTVDMTHLVLIDLTDTITGNNPSNETFDTGTMAVHTSTVPALASAVDGDYITAYNQIGTLFAVGLDTTGGASVTPSGAAWVAADYKVLKDVSGAVSAADVMALVETAFNTLTGFTTSITSNDTAADGTMLLTQIVPGVTSLGNDYSATGAAGTSTGCAVVSTTTGVATEVDIANNKVTIGGTELPTGTKITELTTTGTLPAGLATSTVYYAIANGDGTNSFATSQANALAGTAINITDYGTTTAVHTIVVATALAGTVKLQKNNDSHEVPASSKNWVDIDDSEVLNGNNSRAYSAAGSINWMLTDFSAKELRAVVTNTSGVTVHNLSFSAKGG